ncbi:MAG: polysaccharide deacetylase family protein [Tumebacillaceae bacterium]
MLRVACPATYVQERNYICDVLFGEFLGLAFEVVFEERHDVRITRRDDPLERELVLADVLFQTPSDNWLRQTALPVQPLEQWEVSALEVRHRLVSEQLPVIYGQRLANGHFYAEAEMGIEMGTDLLGSSFFMLTRFEEIANPVRDERERFPSTASLAYQEGFLQRPIVNEYVEVLWWVLAKLWPDLQRKRHEFQMRLTHDVDWPLCSIGRTLPQVVKSAAGDVVKRGSLQLAARRLGSFAQGRYGKYERDLYNTFDRIMDVSERHGLQSAFYFITDHTAGEIDGVYSIFDPWIRKLLRRIHERGHEIGLHPSYDTFRRPEQIKREFANLLQVVEEEGIRQDSFGGRQHYLRWENPTTWRAWDEAGLAYDSTLSFADRIGFRCGTCYEYPVFDLQTRQALSLRERPLIVMEQSVLSDSYMHLSHAEALREVRVLIERCRMFDGTFTLLWHNDQLIREQEFELYQTIVGGG